MDRKARTEGSVFNCPRKSLHSERPPNRNDPKCKARFTDLEVASRPPPEFPPVVRKLTTIQGVKG